MSAAARAFLRAREGPSDVILRGHPRGARDLRPLEDGFWNCTSSGSQLAGTRAELGRAYAKLIAERKLDGPLAFRTQTAHLTWCTPSAIGAEKLRRLDSGCHDFDLCLRHDVQAEAVDDSKSDETPAQGRPLEGENRRVIAFDPPAA